MKDVLLAIIFMVDGTPTIMEGWEPRLFPNMEICEERKEFMELYVDAIVELPEVGVIFCGTSDEIQHQVRILNSEPT